MGDDSRSFEDSNGSFVVWGQPATFEFADEIDALKTIDQLGDELRSARRQVEEITRYLKQAIADGHRQVGVSPQALINTSGLARQTVYDVIQS